MSGIPANRTSLRRPTIWSSRRRHEMTIEKDEIRHVPRAKKTLFCRHYPGYFYCRELIDGDDLNGGPDFEMVCCYSDFNGQYMGDARMARALCRKCGIRQIQLSDPVDAPAGNCCSIGFNEEKQKWYGWSHRAFCGFGIGDMMFAERWIKTDKTPFVKAGKVKIEKLGQAKTAARRFARYVS